MATYANDLRLKEIATGDESGTWGTSTNTNLSLIADAFSLGTKQLAADADETFTMPDAAADGTRSLYLKITSAVSLSVTRTVTLAPNTVSKVWIIENATTGGQSITIAQGSGGTVTIANGSKVMVVTDGAGAGAAVTLANPTVNLASGVTGTLPVANGGTSLTTLTANNVILGNGTSAPLFVAPGTNGNILTSNGTTWTSAAAPSFTQVYPGAGVAVSTGSAWGTSITLGTGVSTFLTTPSSANLAAAVTDETGSGALVFATSPTFVTPVLGTPSSGTLSSCTVDGTNAVGFRTIPQESKSAAYTLVLADSGKHIFHPSADTTARTWTIPANGSVAFPIGTAITFINQNGAGVITIAITTDTMRLSPAGTTGSRTLAANGSATAVKVTSTEWLISGSGLT